MGLCLKLDTKISKKLSCFIQLIMTNSYVDQNKALVCLFVCFQLSYAGVFLLFSSTQIQTHSNLTLSRSFMNHFSKFCFSFILPGVLNLAQTPESKKVLMAQSFNDQKINFVFFSTVFNAYCFLLFPFWFSSDLALYMSLFLVQDPSYWDVIEPLPSYGRGTEVPGGRYQSLINGYKLHDVVITGLFYKLFASFPFDVSASAMRILISFMYILGNNGTIDGMGMVWWDKFRSHSLNYSRPHLVEIVASEYVVVSNLSFLNAPAYSIHPVYCRYTSLLCLDFE